MKAPEYRTLVACKDLMERKIKNNSAFSNVSVQFDFNPTSEVIMALKNNSNSGRRIDKSMQTDSGGDGSHPYSGGRYAGDHVCEANGVGLCGTAGWNFKSVW